MKIAICDKEQFWVDKISAIAEEYYKDIGIEIIKFQKGFDLLKAISYEKFDILILDIEIPDVSGIQIKEKLSSYISSKIIFVTSHKGYWKSAFGMNVIGFVEKANINEITQCFKTVEKLNANHLRIGRQNIDGNAILYIKAEGAYVHIYTNIEELLFCVSLSDIEMRLSSSMFVRIHRSHIVNLKNIKEYEKSRVILIDGRELSISRKYQDVMKERYLNYLQENKGK